MKKIVLFFLSMVACSLAQAQQTDSLEQLYQETKASETIVSEFVTLDSIVKNKVSPDVIDSLQTNGNLAFLSFDTTKQLTGNQYRYDSLAFDFTPRQYNIYKEIKKAGLIPAISNLVSQKMVYLSGRRNIATGVDNPERSKSLKTDAGNYLAMIKQQFAHHTQALAADNWSLNRYMQWEASKNPVSDFDYVVIRKTFLKQLKKTYGYEY